MHHLEHSQIEKDFALHFLEKHNHAFVAIKLDNF